MTFLNISQNFGISRVGDFSHFHAYSARVGSQVLVAGQVVAGVSGLLVPADPYTGVASGVLMDKHGTPGYDALYITRGPIDLNDWTPIIGVDKLSPGSSYFLWPGGLLSTAPPPQDQYMILVGVSQSISILDVSFRSKFAPAV